MADMEHFSGMAIRYGDSIIKKDPYFIMSLCYSELGRAARVSVERSVPVMAAHPVLISLSAGNVVSRSCRSDLMPAGDNRMSVCKHGGA